VAFPNQVQGIAAQVLKEPATLTPRFTAKLGKAFLQRSKDEYQVVHALRTNAPVRISRISA
jgi:hypothetical protein